SAKDQLALENKVTVALYLEANPGVSDADAKAILADVNADSGTASAIAAIDALVSTDSQTHTLTVGQNTIAGSDNGDTFNAPIVQNQNGAVTNTLESGDVLNAGSGVDTLNADLTLTTSAGIPIGPAISPTTNGIEIVNLRAQTPNSDILT